MTTDSLLGEFKEELESSTIAKENNYAQTTDVVVPSKEERQKKADEDETGLVNAIYESLPYAEEKLSEATSYVEQGMKKMGNIVKPVGRSIYANVMGYKSVLPEEHQDAERIGGNYFSKNVLDVVGDKSKDKNLLENDPHQLKELGMFIKSTMFNDSVEFAKAQTEKYPYLRMIQTKDGDVFLYNPKTEAKVIVNPSGWDEGDTNRLIFETAAFGGASSIAYKVADKLIKSGNWLLKGLAHSSLQGVSAGLVAAGIEKGQKELGGEFNNEEVAIATFLGGVPELFIPAIKSYRSGKASFAELMQQNYDDMVRNVYKHNKQEEYLISKGVKPLETIAPQKTLDPVQIAELEKLSRDPATFSKIKKNWEKINVQARRSVSSLLNYLSKTKTKDAYKTTKNAVDFYAENLKVIRHDETSLLYKEIFKDDFGKINTLDLIKDLKSKKSPHTPGFNNDIDKLVEILTPSSPEYKKGVKRLLSDEYYSGIVNKQKLLEVEPEKDKTSGFASILGGKKQKSKKIKEQKSYETELFVGGGVKDKSTLYPERKIRPVYMSDAQAIKMQIYAMMEDISEGKALSGHTKKIYGDTMEAIKQRMYKINPKYKEADALYEKYSHQLKTLESSKLGGVLKAEGEQINKLVKGLFEGDVTKKGFQEDFVYVKNILDEVDPSIAPALVKTRISSVFYSKIKQIGQDKFEKNIPKAFVETMKEADVYPLLDINQKGVLKAFEDLMGSGSVRTLKDFEDKAELSDVLYRPIRKAAEYAERHIYELSINDLTNKLIDPSYEASRELLTKQYKKFKKISKTNKKLHEKAKEKLAEYFKSFMTLPTARIVTTREAEDDTNLYNYSGFEDF